MKNFLGLLSRTILAVLVSGPLLAETQSGVGNPMSFDIGYGIIVNEGSTLNRQWVVVGDSRMPVQIERFNGLTTRLDDRNWLFDASYSLKVSEPITAIEVRFLTFDIWGEKGRSLTTTEVKDFSAAIHMQNATWRVSSENEAGQHYASIAYIAQVKLVTGEVIRADQSQVVDEARRFSENFVAGDLEASE